MAFRYCYRHYLGLFWDRILWHDSHPQDQAHLYFQLVLRSPDNCNRHAAYCEQPGDSSNPWQILLTLCRSPGCGGAVVVRAQCRRISAHRWFSRHDVLFSAQACGSADLELSPVGSCLLDIHLQLYLGWPPSSTFQCNTRMGAVTGDGDECGIAGAVLGNHDQRYNDCQWCLGEAAHRPGPQVHRSLTGILWVGNI